MKPLVQRYKIPLLISLVVGLALIALSREGYWLNALFAFLGAMLGAVLIDFEYIIHAYLVDPKSEQSQEVKRLFESGNLTGLAGYLNHSEYQFGELSIRSALFQVILAVFALYAITTAAWIFMQALTISMFGNLLYVQILELNSRQTLSRWFWIYTGSLSQRFYSGYVVLMVIILVWLFTFV